MAGNDRSRRTEPFFSQAPGQRRKDTAPTDASEQSEARPAERPPAASAQGPDHTIMALQLRIVQLQDQLQRTLAEVESLRRSRAEADNATAKVKDRAERSQTEADGARRALEEAERVLLRLKDQLKRANAEAEDARRAREETERMVLQLKEQLQTARADAASVRRAREDSARSAGQAEERAGQAEERITGLEAKIQELQERLGEARDEAVVEGRRADAAFDKAVSKNADALKQANEKIGALETEVAQLKDQLLRALADAENTRRRLRKEAEDTAKYAIANLAKDLLSAPDNLRRALDNIPAEGRKSDELLDRLATGVELVERELHAILERYGIKKIDPLGQPFDHNFHQALFEVPTADHPVGTVVQVLAPGYVIHERLLRPAMVGVAKAPPAETNGESGSPADTAA